MKPRLKSNKSILAAETFLFQIQTWRLKWNKKAVRYGARNHRAMPFLHIPPSSFAQNLEMFP